MGEKNEDEQWLLDINQQLEDAGQGLQLMDYGRLVDLLRRKSGVISDQLEIARLALEAIRDLAWSFLPPGYMDDTAWRLRKIIEIGRLASSAIRKVSDVGKNPS